MLTISPIKYACSVGLLYTAISTVEVQKFPAKTQVPYVFEYLKYWKYSSYFHVKSYFLFDSRLLTC